MELNVLSSGSHGNCYILENEKESFILECGISIKDIKKGIDFNISKIQGVFVSHDHLDHSKCIDKIEELGIEIYCSKGTAESRDVKIYNQCIDLKWMDCGSFKVLPFDVKHDAPEPMNCIVYHEEMGYVAFITDTAYCPVRMNIIDHWLIEANHNEDINNQNVSNGTLHHSLAKRITENHMSIESCVELLKENKLESTSSIVLCHLSDYNSNHESFKKQIAENVGIMPEIAKKGLSVQLIKK